MRVVVVGSGGREHALAMALGRRKNKVIVTPGNAGIPNSIDTPPGELVADLFVIGPDDAVVSGLADQLRARDRAVFAPGADGGRIEGSKAWMKQLLVDAGVPTAKYKTFGLKELNQATAFLTSLKPPYVIKTDGLAAGKGVLVTPSLEEALSDVRAKLTGRSFGEAGRRIVIEEALIGPEVSLFAICDGERAVPLIVAQDHKRLGDGDTGPNTGGMGAYAPVPFVGQAMVDKIMHEAVAPTLRELRGRGIDYRGVLFCGVIITSSGPKVLEFNARFGDPETQVVLPLMTSDFTQLLFEAATGTIQTEPKFSDNSAVTVILASEGYPVAPRTGDVITGLDKAETVEGVTVFHAGTARNDAGEFITNGGRVLDVTAVAPTLTEARDRAYEAVSYINWPGMQYRTDIARQAIQ